MFFPKYFLDVLVVGLIVLLCGCMAQPQVMMLGDAGNPKTDAENIDIYYTKRPERDYKEIARIEVGDTNDEYNLEQILLKARGMGADAVIIIGRSGSYGYVSGAGTGSSVNGSTSTFGTYSGVSVGAGYGLVAVAIQYK